MTLSQLKISLSPDEVRGFASAAVAKMPDVRLDSLDFGEGEVTAAGAYRVLGRWVGLRAVLKPALDATAGRFGVRLAALNLAAVPFVGLAFVASKIAAYFLENVPFAEMDGETVWLDAAKIAAEKCPGVAVAGQASAFAVSSAGIELALGEGTVIYNRNDLKSSLALDGEPCYNMSIERRRAMIENREIRPSQRGLMPPRIEEIISPRRMWERLKERLALSAVSRVLTPKIYDRAVDEFARRISCKR